MKLELQGTDRWFVTVAVVFFLLGSMGLLKQALLTKNEANHPEQQQYVKFAVTGRLLLPAGADASKALLRIHLPEIPLDVAARGGRLLDARGNFRLTGECQSRVVPRHFSLEAQAPGSGRLRLHQLSFTQKDDSLVCHLDNLRLPEMAVR